MPKYSFSKLIMIFETILVAIMTLGGLFLAYLAIIHQMDSSLPWIVTSTTTSWAAYGFSAKYYYSKALAENTKGGITYDKAFELVNNIKEETDDFC